MVISQQQYKDFYEKGYFVLHNVISKPEINEIKKSFDRLQKIAEQFTSTQVYHGSQFVVEGKRIDRIVWMGGAEPALLKYGEDPRILNPVSEILDVREFDQLICQGHYKLPGDQVKFDWHQDCQHRGYGAAGEWVDVDGKGSYVQTLMAIDEVTEENGPVLFVPTDTKKGYIGLDKHQNPFSLFDAKTAVPVLMQPGDIAFFSPYSIHGSQPNNSNGPRRVFINGFASPGANRKEYPGEGSGRRVRLS